MRIRVVVRVPRRKHRALKLSNLIGNLPCLLGHHQSKIEIRDKQMALRCERCGWRSAGWEVGTRHST